MMHSLCKKVMDLFIMYDTVCTHYLNLREIAAITGNFNLFINCITRIYVGYGFFIKQKHGNYFGAMSF